MNNKFQFRVMSDSNYEKLIVEFFCGDDLRNDFIGLINQEKGIDSLELEIYPKTNGQPWKFNLEEFVDVLHQAKRHLLK